MKNNYIILLFLTIIFFGCEKEPDYTNLHSISIQPPFDTLQMYEDRKYKNLSLSGTFQSEVTNTIKNKGITTGAEYTIKTIETNHSYIPSEDAFWYSSNKNVAEVFEGRVSPVNPGFTEIYAELHDILSDTITIEVLETFDEPEITFYIPTIILVFERIVIIIGRTLENCIVEIAGNVVNLNQNGEFNYTYSDLTQGMNTIDIVSYNANNHNVYTTKSITVYYYPFQSSAADNIAGSWQGNFGNQTFDFTISDNNIDYDVVGTISIEFEFLGWINNIPFSGKVEENGQLNASVNYSIEGLTITGGITGQFTSTSSMVGDIYIEAEQSNWIKIGYSKSFTASKN